MVVKHEKQGIHKLKGTKWKLPINVEKSEMVYLHLTLFC